MLNENNKTSVEQESHRLKNQKVIRKMYNLLMTAKQIKYFPGSLGLMDIARSLKCTSWVFVRLVFII